MFDSFQNSKNSIFRTHEKAKGHSFHLNKTPGENFKPQHANVDSQIKMIDMSMQNEIESDEKKFKVLKHEMMTLEQMLKELNIAYEVTNYLNFQDSNEKSVKEIRLTDKQIYARIDKEKINTKENEYKLMKKYQEASNQLRNEFSFDFQETEKANEEIIEHVNISLQETKDEIIHMKEEKSHYLLIQ